MKVKVKETNGKKLALVENKWCEVFKESPLNYFVIIKVKDDCSIRKREN